MDHNLEDSLNMESIENMDFDHSGVVVNQEDIVLEDSGQSGDIPMDMETIEEEPQTILGTENEEVIVSDFISDQFGYQEYTIQSENTSGANITIDATQLGAISSQNEQMTDVQYDCISKANTSQPNVITLKAAPQQRANKKAVPVYAYARRQVAIAPKPAKVAPNVQYAIAPKPVTLVVNKTNMAKMSGAKNIVQGIKGNTVLAQIGKQLVMMPAGAAGQKIKLSGILPSGSTDSNVQILRCGNDSAQLISNKGATPLRTKLIVQGSGQEGSNQPAVITKLLPVATSAGVTPRARYVMQQKTVPISIGGNKVVLTTPPKQAVTASKKQIISIKAQSSKAVTSQANVQTKKVLITANQTLKPSSQVAVKDSNVQGQRTQLHSINVPGKGIQFIKLVTNQSAVPKAAPTKTVAVSGKNFVLTDSKGNIIQMSAEKLISGQPPPLIVTSSASTGSGSKVVPTMNKLVRIAPISHRGVNPSEKVREVTKMAYCVQPKQPRASQSLLMPRDAPKPANNTTTVSLEEFNEMVDQNNISNYTEEVVEEDVGLDDTEKRMTSADVKPNLASLLSSAANDEENVLDMSNIEEVEIEYDNTPCKQERYAEENSNSMEQDRSAERTESLIIVPSDSHVNPKLEQEETHEGNTDRNRNQMESLIDIDPEDNPYLSPQMDQNYPDSMFMYDGKAEPPGVRPRKACNCTKSQCLKLYCDCFANGEFCNNCNCNNCHNNLDNEERRQKAIRACLERNPNAFRPKIGKAKSGGPEIVRRHNKGCHCKRSGCLKNYCECYEAKIACTLMCKCFGCRNVEDTIDRRRDALRVRERMADPAYRAPLPMGQVKQPCSFMTMQVIEAVAQCMIASVAQGADSADPVEDVLLEFSRCMADIISASHCSL